MGSYSKLRDLKTNTVYEINLASDLKNLILFNKNLTLLWEEFYEMVLFLDSNDDFCQLTSFEFHNYKSQLNKIYPH